jgi:hypothetical protein
MIPFYSAFITLRVVALESNLTYDFTELRYNNYKESVGHELCG